MNNPLNPDVPVGQFALIQVELRTGIVLNLDGNRHTSGPGEWFLLFESLPAAKERAQHIIRLNPEIECSIQDDKNRAAATIRNERYIQAILEQSREAREQKRKWWKFW
jgi:hypothetical protein